MGRRLLSVIAATLFHFPSATAPAQTNLGTAITYQGHLAQGNAAFNGNADVRFAVFDVATGGSPLAMAEASSVPVSDGQFTATPDFGGVFDGRALWLELAVRVPPGTGAYTTLLPRQSLTAAPYALGLRLPVEETVAVPNDNALRIHNTASGGRGVLGLASGADGKGVYGSGTGAGSYGLYGDCGPTAAGAVLGLHSTSGTAGALGTLECGVSGYSGPTGIAVAGTHPTSYGSLGSGHYGVFGYGSVGGGVRGNHTGSQTFGILGTSVSGVYGYGRNLNGAVRYAGDFDGNVRISGDVSMAARVSTDGPLDVGTTLNVAGDTLMDQFLEVRGGSWIYGGLIVFGNLSVSNGSKNFRIDHPLEPESKYLIHASIESSERKNLYDGVATLDQRGRAVVELPSWFEALNDQFRYQLTPIGGPGPDLHIAEEIVNNRFTIAGGRAAQRVSWQITGVRRDRWAAANPFQVEVLKANVAKAESRAGLPAGGQVDPSAIPMSEMKGSVK